MTALPERSQQSQSPTNHARPFGALQRATRKRAFTKRFFGADDGIRTRDPRLGKVIAPELPTCTFAN
jgi:hypothetical protein